MDRLACIFSFLLLALVGVYFSDADESSSTSSAAAVSGQYKILGCNKRG